MNDFRQAAIDAILEDLDFDSVKELRAYVSKNKQDDYFYGGILYAINAVQDLSSAQPEIIHCRDCRWRKDQSGSTEWLPCRVIVTPSDFYCGRAERRTDGR